MTTRAYQTRQGEQGGIAILVALILLSIMSVTAFGLSRNSLREIAITGNESVGRKAFEAADSGLDWVITWGHPGATPVSTAQTTLRTQMNAILDAIDNSSMRVLGADATSSTAGSGNTSNVTGTYRVYLNSATLQSDLVASTANYKQSTVVVPAFDLEVRFLGFYPGTKKSVWMVRSMGRANVGTTGQSFLSSREALLEYVN